MKRLVSLFFIFALILALGSAVRAQELSDAPAVAAEEEEEFISLTEDDTEALFAGYVEREFGLSKPRPMLFMASVPRRLRLTDNEKAIYDRAADFIRTVAAGEQGFTELTVPVSSTKAEVTNVIYALVYDLPYDLYWFDKPKFSFIRRTDSTVLYFRVSADYSADGTRGTLYADTNKTGAVKNAVANAQQIIDRYKGASDYEKLRGYRNEICRLVSYDYQAFLNTETPYGDPWQIVSVFDGNPATNVVCEGYAKAFQYLCDNTEFESGLIECRLMDGKQDDLSHMWNVVRMDDGENYLVDLTTYDDASLDDHSYDPEESGYAGYNGSGAFLVGGSYLGGPGKTGYTSNPYWIYGNPDNTAGKSRIYRYHNNAIALYSDAERTLSLKNYVPERARLPVYRFYSPYTREHFYTTDEREKNALCANSRWNFEGTGWYSPLSGTPVYRLYNPQVNTHLFTADTGVRDSSVSSGWIYEGIGWYSDPAQGQRVYVLYNSSWPAAGTTLYTADTYEISVIIHRGWVEAGTAWYGME